jgi:hypothetical protein
MYIFDFLKTTYRLFLSNPIFNLLTGDIGSNREYVYSWS